MKFREGAALIKSVYKPPITRIAFEVPREFNDKKKGKIDVFRNIMEDLLKQEKKVYSCFCTARDLKDYIKYFSDEQLIGDDEDIKKHYIEIHRLGDDEYFLTVKDMNNEWAKVQLVAVSPSVTIGCSFNPKDENGNDKPVFDTTMIKLADTCTVRDIMQTHFRVRNTKSNTIYYQLPTKVSAANSRRKYEQYRRFLDNFKNYFDNIHFDNMLQIKKLMENNLKILSNLKESGKLSFIENSENEILTNLNKTFSKYDKEMPLSYKLNYALCFREIVLNSLYYPKFVEEYLKLCGYEIKPYDGEIRESGKIQKNSITFHYADIPEIYTFSQHLELKEKLSRSEASSKVKAIISRYEFDERFDLFVPEKDRAKIFHAYFYPHPSKVFENIHCEQETSLVKNLKRDSKKCNYDPRYLPNTYLKVKIIQILNKLLGLHSSIESGVSLTADFLKSDKQNGQSLFEFLKNNQDDILKEFNIRNKSLDNRDPVAMTKIINSIYSNFSGMTFINPESNAKRKCEKWVSYSLIPETYRTFCHSWDGNNPIFRRQYFYFSKPYFHHQKYGNLTPLFVELITISVPQIKKREINMKTFEYEYSEVMELGEIVDAKVIKTPITEKEFIYSID